jgi:hypothetical protein
MAISPHLGLVLRTLSAGVLCIEGFASPDECAALMKRAVEIVEEFDPKTFTVFDTKGEQVRVLVEQ